MAEPAICAAVGFSATTFPPIGGTLRAGEPSRRDSDPSPISGSRNTCRAAASPLGTALTRPLASIVGMSPGPSCRPRLGHGRRCATAGGARQEAAPPAPFERGHRLLPRQGGGSRCGRAPPPCHSFSAGCCVPQQQPVSRQPRTTAHGEEAGRWVGGKGQRGRREVGVGGGEATRREEQQEAAQARPPGAVVAVLFLPKPQPPHKHD